MRQIGDKIVAWILGIPQDKRLHFVAGFVVATFFGLALGMKFNFWPVLFFAFGKEFFDQWTGGEWDWWDFAATCLGGLLAQSFVLLNMWWF